MLGNLFNFFYDRAIVKDLNPLRKKGLLILQFLGKKNCIEKHIELRTVGNKIYPALIILTNNISQRPPNIYQFT